MEELLIGRLPLIIGAIGAAVTKKGKKLMPRIHSITSVLSENSEQYWQLPAAVPARARYEVTITSYKRMILPARVQLDAIGRPAGMDGSYPIPDRHNDDGTPQAVTVTGRGFFEFDRRPRIIRVASVGVYGIAKIRVYE